MKAAIITLTSYGQNYGNRLQNYSMQEMLKYLGAEPETLSHISNPIFFSSALLKKKLKNFAKKLLKRNTPRNLRDKMFYRFNRSKIHYSRYSFGNNKVSSGISAAYDYFIIGSDQVWNANFNSFKKDPDIFLASFAPPTKRIAYSASFGTSEIPDEYIDKFKSELPKFKAISVREEAGVRLAEQCGAEAVVTLDPTMMLTPDKWNEVASKPKFVSDEPYILTYYLGGRSDEMKKYISRLAGGRRVINLEHENIKASQIEDLAVYAAAPDEFVWLIAHADCVLTDSFHASVFSILYHKSFLVFERLVNGESGGMESRIDTLLGMFGMSKNKGDIRNPEGMPPEDIDWTAVDAELTQRRASSLQFLKNALDIG